MGATCESRFFVSARIQGTVARNKSLQLASAILSSACCVTRRYTCKRKSGQEARCKSHVLSLAWGVPCLVCSSQQQPAAACVMIFLSRERHSHYTCTRPYTFFAASADVRVLKLWPSVCHEWRSSRAQLGDWPPLEGVWQLGRESPYGASGTNPLFAVFACATRAHDFYLC